MTPVEKAVIEGINKGIQAELASYVFYRKALDVTKDDRIKEILEWLAGEEKQHYKLLETQHDSLIRSEKWVTYNDIMRSEDLPNIDEHMEEVHDAYLDEVDENITPKRILEIGLALEERARDLYADLAEKMEDPKGKETYEYLVRFETGHVAKIQKLMKDMGLS